MEPEEKTHEATAQLTFSSKKIYARSTKNEVVSELVN